MSNSNDNNWVVVVDGKRVSKTLSQQEAEQEASRRRNLSETEGSTQANVEVKQNLCG